MKRNFNQVYLLSLSIILILPLIVSCTMMDDKIDILGTNENKFEDRSGLYIENLDYNYPVKFNSEAVFLLIDEESIDNGKEPNNFKDWEINDHISKIGLRTVLPYFKENIGKKIPLHTGHVGDEGWFAPTQIPLTWINSGLSGNGTFNFLFGPGFGLGYDGNDYLLDKVPGVVPLRATGLKMLIGKTVYAVVYDSDISINYDPLTANLQGESLGVVAFTVLDVVKRKNGSSSSLPTAIVRVENASKVFTYPQMLFFNAPKPESSSEPMDILIPNNVAEPLFVKAN